MLFMVSSGFLVSPARNPSKQPLWDETWKRVDRFLPDLRNDLASENLEISGTEGRRAQNNDDEMADESHDVHAIVDINGGEDENKD